MPWDSPGARAGGRGVAAWIGTTPATHPAVNSLRMKWVAVSTNHTSLYSNKTTPTSHSTSQTDLQLGSVTLSFIERLSSFKGRFLHGVYYIESYFWDCPLLGGLSSVGRSILFQSVLLSEVSLYCMKRLSL